MGTEIKQWHLRVGDDGMDSEDAMQEEIAELRAALEAKQQALEAAHARQFELESPPVSQPVGAVVADEAREIPSVDTPEFQRLAEYWRNEPYGTRSFENGWAELIAHIDAYARAALASQPAKPADVGGVVDERAAFEKAMNAARFFPAELDFSLTKSPSGKRDEYVNTHLESCWNGWQARAALAAQTAAPEFSHDPDGDLALDWVVGGNALSVSFSVAGAVSWAVSMADGSTAKGAEQVAQTAAPGVKPALPFAIEDDSLASLKRFYECALDGEGHDVPASTMKVLAGIGLLHHRSAGHYETSEFGLAVLNGDFAAPAPAEPVDLSGLQRYDAGITSHEHGSVGLVKKDVGRAVLLDDVRALLAAAN